MCSECVTRRANVSRLRDQHQQLYRRKVELCRRIEVELRPLSCAQADVHAATRRINAMRAKIDNTRERIERYRRLIAVQNTRYDKCAKNVLTLEVCFSHS